MDFKGILCWFFVTVIVNLVYTQEITPDIELPKSEQACQRYQHLRENLSIVNKSCDEEKLNGGIYSNINEFPHVVAIGYANENGDYFIGCSGSLVSEKFVLTAAHCLNNKFFVPKIVRLGKTSINDKKDCNDAIDVNIISTSINVHKDYNKKIKHNDIALLELEEKVDKYFSSSLFPACLHYGSGPTSDLLVSSWMRNINGVNALHTKDSTNWLQKVSMQEMTLTNCREKYEGSPMTIVESQICATSPTHANNTCEILGGSPLQYKLNNTYYVAGIVSFGGKCENKLPEILTRVSSYIGWIENIVWP